MAPTTRSTPSTPPSARSSESPSSTPRKTPHCTKCKRPRAGHPRQGCPYTDTSPTAVTTKSQGMSDDPEISDVLSQMRIQPAPLRRSDAQVIPQDNMTLASLSTTSSEIVRNLLSPSMMDNSVTSSGDGGLVEKWRESTGSPQKPTIKVQQGTTAGGANMPARSPMPGTLGTPWTSFNTNVPAFRKSEPSPIARSDIPECTEYASTQSPSDIYSDSPSAARARPLVRSMSAEDRSLFLEELTSTSKAPPATVYILSAEDVFAVRAAAHKLGFASRVADNKSGEKDVSLILGREDAAVQALYERISMDRGGNIRAAAGGAVVGAVATFTGLAFS